ncbi:MAG: radical SAM protein [Dehalococcoidia bacterium]|nr:radical SAM protein [Dehalococcoidia bacterium]
MMERPAKIGDAQITYSRVGDILTRATGFMDAYDYTLNPYSGCFFGCTYCYAAFFSRDIEKRDSWGHWLVVKKNAVELLEKRKRGDLDGKLIYMSSVTDPYQPVERELGLTRRLLEAMVDRLDKPKLVVQTRSPDVARDCDLFRRIEENGGRVQINMTATTDDEDIRRTFEPFCPSNPVRLNAIGEVQSEGVDACITMTPLLLVSNPSAFAESLCDTGVQKFIAQPFHFQRGKFLAGTRDNAFDLMAEKLGCSRDSFRSKYLDHYKSVFGVLRDALPELGEGKAGFKPPF